MKILIATDGSSYSNVAVSEAAARPWPSGSELRVLVVLEHPAISYVTGEELGSAIYYQQIAKELRKSLEALATMATEQLKGKDHTVSYTVREGIAAEEIIDEAKQWHADLIMVGTHGRHGISRFLLGSVAQKVSIHAPCSVEIVRRKA
ncbi:MAG: universal stress protein [Acidobacteriota bacterium]